MHYNHHKDGLWDDSGNSYNGAFVLTNSSSKPIIREVNGTRIIRFPGGALHVLASPWTDDSDLANRLKGTENPTRGNNWFACIITSTAGQGSCKNAETPTQSLSGSDDYQIQLQRFKNLCNKYGGKYEEITTSPIPIPKCTSPDGESITSKINEEIRQTITDFFSGDGNVPSSGINFGWEHCRGTGSIMCTITVIFNWLAIGVSAVVVIMIVVGAIQYMTGGKGGEDKKAKQGMTTIRNAIIALVLYMIMWAFLNFLLPGGPFG